MLVDHHRVIHLVDVIAREDQNQVGTVLLDGIDILIDGIRSAPVPAFANTLLGGEDVNEFIQFAAEKAPAEVDVPIEAGRLVLGQNQDPPQATVDAVRQRKVDNSIRCTERNGGLGPFPGERFQSRSLASGQNQRQHTFHSISPWCGYSISWEEWTRLMTGGPPHETPGIAF